MENAPVVIGRYRLSKTLGIGAFGKVKLGEHMLTRHKVAVKILNRSRIQAMDMREKVKREINILKLCRHPHIVRLHEVIDTPSDIFMVMEYAPNGELFDYIVSKGRPTIEEAQRLFQQIVTAVEYCHYHHIVHRDLKPENLLLDQDNNLKIADFGLSNMMRDGEFLRTSCGSPNYAAPEVIMGTLYAGPEVDVWSCGVILYALLCGSLPFDDESIPSLFKKIKSGMYSLPSHLSPLTRDLVPRMLVVDPMKRITIAEIKQHPWFMQSIPLYLTLSPEQMEEQAAKVDEEVVSLVCKLPFKGVTRERVLVALAHKGFKKKGEYEHELRVVYELIQGNKLHKERLKQCVLANRLHKQTPPAFTPGRGQRPGANGRHPGGYPRQDPVVEAADRLMREGLPRTPGTSPTGIRDPLHGGGGGGGLGVGSRGGLGDGVAGAGAFLPAKRRKWYLGIQSKKDPAHVMTEVYRALLQLGCKWRMLSSYRIQCMWRPDEESATLGPAVDGRAGVFEQGASALSGTGVGSGVSQGGGGGGSGGSVAGGGGKENTAGKGYRVIAGLTLYKVQVNIYLLDFHKREGDQFSFMTLCARIIIQLKTLSAQGRQVASRLQPHAHSAVQAVEVQQQMHAQQPASVGVGVGVPGYNIAASHQHSNHQQRQQQHQPHQPIPGIPRPGHYLASPSPPPQQHRAPGMMAPVTGPPLSQQIQHGYGSPQRSQGVSVGVGVGVGVVPGGVPRGQVVVPQQHPQRSPRPRPAHRYD